MVAEKLDQNIKLHLEVHVWEVVACSEERALS